MGRYKNFVDAWGAHERGSAKILSIWLDRQFHMNSIVDIGCGNGVFLLDFMESGKDILGIDYEDNAKKLIGKRLVIADLTKPLELDKKYELALCIEVIEHIDQKYEDVVIQSIANAADIIVFSGAKPNQIGENHINCQAKEYWLEKFNAVGIELWIEKSEELIEYISAQSEFLKCPWLVENLMILKRSE